MPNAEMRERHRGDALKQSPLRVHACEDANAHQHAEKACARVSAGSDRTIVPSAWPARMHP